MEVVAREAAAKERTEATIMKARDALDKFYEDYNEKNKIQIAKNKWVPYSSVPHGYAPQRSSF